MTIIQNAKPTIADFLETRGLKLTGPRGSHWKTTSCEFHSGSDSMRVNTQTGGWCCMACDAHGGDAVSYLMQVEGLDFVEACKALGCWQDDGKTPTKPFKPAGLRPHDALQILSIESLICALVSTDASHGKTISQTDAERCRVAAGRIQQIAGEVLA